MLGFHFLFNERQEYHHKYHHKSGTQKRREKAMRAEGVKGQNTLKHMVLIDVSDSVKRFNEIDKIRDNQGRF